MFDAGHTHGPTPHFVSDCPLCDAAKEARNQALTHLNEALRLLSCNNDGGEDSRPTLRLNLAPIGITGDDTQRCHSIDLTAKQAEALSAAVDSMNAFFGSEQPQAPLVSGLYREAIESGEFSAGAVAQCNPVLYAEVTDAFDAIDPISLLDEVFRSERPGDAADAYEELTGEWNGEL